MMRLARAAGLAFFFLCTALLSASLASEFSELSIATKSGPVTFSVERAVTPQEMARGLMFRREMPADEGMLFDHQRERMANMWMRNTYIPLDMIFIDGSGEIRHIAKRTTPLSERTISSRVQVRYVLEINGGLSDALGIAVGQTVTGPALSQ